MRVCVRVLVRRLALNIYQEKCTFGCDDDVDEDECMRRVADDVNLAALTHCVTYGYDECVCVWMSADMCVYSRALLLEYWCWGFGDVCVVLSSSKCL